MAPKQGTKKGLIAKAISASVSFIKGKIRPVSIFTEHEGISAETVSGAAKWILWGSEAGSKIGKSDGKIIGIGPQRCQKIHVGEKQRFK